MRFWTVLALTSVIGCDAYDPSAPVDTTPSADEGGGRLDTGDASAGQRVCVGTAHTDVGDDGTVESTATRTIYERERRVVDASGPVDGRSIVTTWSDEEGRNIERVMAYEEPDGLVETGRTTWTYDARGRLRVEEDVVIGDGPDQPRTTRFQTRWTWRAGLLVTEEWRQMEGRETWEEAESFLRMDHAYDEHGRRVRSRRVPGLSSVMDTEEGRPADEIVLIIARVHDAAPPSLDHHETLDYNDDRMIEQQTTRRYDARGRLVFEDRFDYMWAWSHVEFETEWDDQDRVPREVVRRLSWEGDVIAETITTRTWDDEGRPLLELRQATSADDSLEDVRTTWTWRCTDP